ncbi:MAG: YhgE/Pip domain-containing protein, partial [Cellulomonadaceae bacterium]
MNGIWALVRRDVRRATSNVMALIVLFGLVVIPSLFTWFNVIASWDPFANTKNLTVAVASLDEGYESDLIPIRITLGDQVLSELRANDDLDWVITSASDAVDGTRSGTYYAAIVLPASFSADMMTFYAPGAQRTDIAYYTNEKKSALAPKITGQGADEVSRRVNEVFTQTLSDVGLSIISSLSDFLTDADTQAVLSRLQLHAGQVAAQLRSASQSADLFTGLIDSSESLVRSSARLIDASRQSFTNASDAIGGGVDAARDLAGTLDSAAAALSDALTGSVQSYQAAADRIDELYADVDAQAGSQVAAIQAVAAQVQAAADEYEKLRQRLADEIGPQLPDTAQEAVARVVAALDDAIAHQRAVHDALIDAADRVATSNDGAQATRQELLDLVAQAAQSIDDVRTDYDDNLKPRLEELSGTISSASATLAGVGDQLSSAASSLTGSADSVVDRLDGARTTITTVSQELAEAATMFDSVEQALAQAGDTGDLTGL